jgi:hypothetical protein
VPELRARIFDAFYSGTARGTGLGLAIVKRIADAHGARVEVRPREGGGSVFAFVVPRGSSPPWARRLAAPGERPPEPCAGGGQCLPRSLASTAAMKSQRYSTAEVTENTSESSTATDPRG